MIHFKLILVTAVEKKLKHQMDIIYPDSMT